MNYEEALQHALTVKWKISTCQQGEICWCRLIEPEEELKDDDGNEIYVVGSGCIPKEYAEYIVQLHNDNVIE